MGAEASLVARWRPRGLVVTPGEEFEACAPMRFAIAYRMRASVSDAEDAVQEACRVRRFADRAHRGQSFFGGHRDARAAVRPRAPGDLRGTLVSGPLLTDPYEDPARAVELADSLSMAALVILERLSRRERAVFVLREVCGFEFTEIASSVGRSEAACRQLAVGPPPPARGPLAIPGRHGKPCRAGPAVLRRLPSGGRGRAANVLGADVRPVGDRGPTPCGGSPSWEPAGSGAFWRSTP